MLLELAELKSDSAIRSLWGGETHAKKACRVLRYLTLGNNGAPISGWTGGGIEHVQQNAGLGSMRVLNLRRRVGVKELFQPLVLETLDHAYSAYMRYAAVDCPQ